MMRRLAPVLAVVASAALAACNQQRATTYFEVVGGGFLFNYRIAEVTVDIVVAPQREIPEGASIEINFENPAGGPAIVMKKDAGGLKTQLEFYTPPLFGVVANKPYAATIRLLASNGAELQRLEKAFHSELNQSVLPPKPLTIGPGYTPNPALTPSP